MACSVAGVMLAMYIVQVTADDSELDLDNQKLKQTTIVYAQNKETGNWDRYATFSGNNNRIWKPLDEMPLNLQNAVIAIEDKGFYSEPGINIKRTIGAALNEFTDNAIYGRTTGASTIEQQLVKNLTGDDEDDYMRKVREIFRAIGLCNRYSKATILEAYLNTIPLTGQIYGMEVGANTYFGKTVSELTLSECAVLASITNNPTAYNPFTNPEQLLSRRNNVLWEMLDQGLITQEEYDSAVAESITVVEDDASTEVATVTSNNSYFTDALYEDLVDAIQEEYGLSEDEAEYEVLNGGLQVYSTVDTTIQSSLERLMLNTDDAIFPALWTEEEVPSNIPADSEITYDDNGRPLQPNSKGEMVAVFGVDDSPVYTDDTNTTLKTTVDEDNNTITFYKSVRTQAAAAVVGYDGSVLAVVGGVGEKTNDLVFNRATEPHQTGSTAKPIAAYCLAIDNNLLTYSSGIQDLPLYSAAEKKVLKSQYSWMDPYSAEAQSRSDVWRSWPENYGGSGGDGAMVLACDALRKSLNTCAVRVGSMVGAEMMFNFVHDTLQCEYLDPEHDMDLAPMVMGSQYRGITSVELAAAYTIFYDGTFTTPHYFTEVEDSDGKLYLDNNKRISTTQAIKPTTATIMNRMLQNVLHGSGSTANGMMPETANDIPAAAKTGTTSDFRDYNFVGMTPYFVTAVWWGYDQPRDMRQVNWNIDGKPTQYLWKYLVEDVLADAPYADFPMADGVVTKQYNPSTGAIVSSGGATGYYTEDNLPEDVVDPTVDPYALAAQQSASQPEA
ncbi:transglycosylase domain-containing protein [uncultured Gemmiger sp.]|uniref:transglycosylase domain-containing protein n=1 Tax=uncultured Gemmiger sp. TaxID=1623490 RepID=UPI0025D8B808|nr:transglycosylase domain-containing protein [uncultured Gemmiger sp.]